jgi:DNA-binding CsgD family transcriptional regulator/predicted negative regulator of RcsB-dependent stress response
MTDPAQRPQQATPASDPSDRPRQPIPTGRPGPRPHATLDAVSRAESIGNRQPPTQLLERAGELSAVSALVEATSAGRGGLMLIEAAPGVGKSSLLERAADAAADLGHLVLRARGHELEQAFAWGVARTLFEGWTVGRPEAERADLLAGLSAPARRVLDLTEPPDGTPARESAVAILHGLYWLAVRLAGRAPLLIAVDDAQWADGPSLRWLVYLMGRLADQPIGVLVASRAGELGEDGLLAVLAGDPEVAVRELAPLGPNAVAELVRRRRPTADAEFCRRCFELTGGNPLHLRELLTAIEAQLDGPDADILAAGAQLAARSLARSVQRRLAGLRTPARQLARAAAVFEVGVPLRLAAALADVDALASTVAADELARSDLLRPGDPLEFVHPLMRAAIYRELPLPERAQIHRRAAALLAADGAAAELVSAHLIHSSPAGDDEVVAVLRLTARRAFVQGAPASSIRYLDRALREPPSPEALPGVLAELSSAEGALGRSEAVAHLETAIELVEDPRSRAALLLELGRLLHDRGRLDEACAACLRGRDELTGPDMRPDPYSALALDLEAGYLTAAMLSPGQAADAYRRVPTILSRPTRLASAADRALTSKAMIMQLFAGGRCSELLPLARNLFDGGRLVAEGGAESQALWHTMGALSYCDDYPAADHAFRLAFEDAERRGSVLSFAGVSMLRARKALWTGPVADAEHDARTAFEIWYPVGHMYVSAAGLSLVCALLHQDEIDQAEAVLDQLEEHPTTFGIFAAWRLAAAGRIAVHRGQDADAVKAFLACGQHLAEVSQVNPAVLSWRSEAGLAALRLGRRELAEELVAAELNLAEAFGGPRAIGVARRAAGLLARGEAAVTLLHSAADLHSSCGAQVEHAHTMVETGAAVRRVGRPAEGRQILRRALTSAEHLGAVHLAQRARAEITLAGGRAPARFDSVRVLTPSEQRVAELAARGQTNRQIADSLFITVKAVEWHLGNAYRKLRIRGRAELAGSLADTTGYGRAESGG